MLADAYSGSMSIAIYHAHELDLLRLFSIVISINADSIDPEVHRRALFLNLAHYTIAVPANQHCLAIDDDQT